MRHLSTHGTWQVTPHVSMLGGGGGFYRSTDAVAVGHPEAIILSCFLACYAVAMAIWLVRRTKTRRVIQASSNLLSVSTEAPSSGNTSTNGEVIMSGSGGAADSGEGEAARVHSLRHGGYTKLEWLQQAVNIMVVAISIVLLFYTVLRPGGGSVSGYVHPAMLAIAFTLSVVSYHCEARSEGPLSWVTWVFWLLATITTVDVYARSATGAASEPFDRSSSARVPLMPSLTWDELLHVALFDLTVIQIGLFIWREVLRSNVAEAPSSSAVADPHAPTNLSVPLLHGTAKEKEADTDTSVHAAHPSPSIAPPPPSAEVPASLISRLTFYWLSPFMAIGKQRPLVTSDLNDLNPKDYAGAVTDVLEAQWQRELRRASHPLASPHGTAQGPVSSRLPSVTMALGRSFGVQFLRAGADKLIYDILTLLQPVLLNLILTYLEESDLQPFSHGLLYVVLLLVSATTASILLNHYFQLALRCGMHVASSLTTLVYRKATRVIPGQVTKLDDDDSDAKKGQTKKAEASGAGGDNTADSAGGETAKSKSVSVGEIVNLMSVDTERVRDMLTYTHLIWSSPFQVVLCVALLLRVVGVAAFVGMGVMVLMGPLTATLLKRMETLQKEIMKLRDERVKMTNETLAGMKIVKLYAWEKPMGQRVRDVRNKELAILWKYLSLEVLSWLGWMSLPTIVAAATFAAYTLLGNTIDAPTAFTGLSLFNILTFPMQAIPYVIMGLVETRTSLGRIQKFLLGDEITPLPALSPVHAAVPPGTATVECANMKLAWPNGTVFLDNISLTCQAGQLTMIVGPVGAGKSGLLLALIGDLTPASGTCSVVGSLAYAAQTAWIQNCSLRDNILFGRAFDQGKYDRVVEACALKPDFSVLPAGDQTEIGEKGINLSGGQKQRVALARAVYSDADVYLLDDTLSAVDSHVAHHIMSSAILGLLKQANKTIVMVTHNLHVLPMADQIVTIQDGGVHFTGEYQAFRESGGDLATFLNTEEDEEDDAGDAGHVDEEEADDVLMDEIERNLLDAKGPSRQRSASSDRSGRSGRSGKRKKSMHDKDKEAQAGDAAKKKDSTSGALIEDETAATGAVSRKVYRDYVREGGVGILVAAGAFLVLSQVFQISANSWLSYWADHPYVLGSILNSLGVYSALCIVDPITMFISLCCGYLLSWYAAGAMHERLLSSILRATQAFFDTTPTGRILNRFSKDIETIDERLLASLWAVLFETVALAGSLLVILYVAPWVLLAVLPLAALYWLTQQYYIPTSRQLRRLNNILKSPVFSHFSETLEGVSTIRAFRAEHEFRSENARKVDKMQRAYFLSWMANRWLAVRLEFIGNIIVSLAGLICVLGASHIPSGMAGLCLTYALMVTEGLNWLVRNSCDLETNIVCVERVQEYATTLPQEAALVVEGNRPPSDWPQKGRLSLKNLQVRYRPGLPLVLKGLTVTIEGGQKIGIVGRTGAGKSTLMQVLLRLVEPTAGYIEVDGIECTKIGLDDLRKQFSIIPQDPVLFTGSVRFNIDPFARHSDEEVWQALRRSHLSDFVSSLPDGLSSVVEEGGRNFSQGQRQLLCLGRALLRRSKIILLDEATSAVDHKTDALIQTTIREEFRSCTVLTIAHRIHTILDSDKVLVMDHGLVAEFDSPKRLLQRRTSIFSSIAAQAGITDATTSYGSRSPRPS
ncbi:unnamed protein product [Vitrella brassicaformis CCMP3155]|uniref:Uncharacterized protein n=4 Tax=Vitrella brassicaformis TaxID=1169539 RepID=A0A0G4GSQ8_VITBC|nr:unnamed protein product [Vitrella brassicaformis CCMP3155]|eukprot:CEM33729.1 unnamed protein product [Vitrella brassicaformis CCMP3155]